jgi:hypothetical protein
MTAKDALDEFSRFVAQIFKDIDHDPRKQTEKLARTINGVLERHGIPNDAKLIPTTASAPTCKVWVVLNLHRAEVNVSKGGSYHVQEPCRFSVRAAELCF